MFHNARRQAFGGRAYDERLTRLKLRQAYGRLIRRADDRGVFVLLDPLPSRLLDAFPPAVTPERVGLAEAVATVTDFVGTHRRPDSPPPPSPPAAPPNDPPPRDHRR